MGDEARGPYLKAAFFCESVLEERTGVISAIRIVERMQVDISLEARQAVEDVPPTLVELTTVVLLVNGARRGPLAVRVVARAPSGREAGIDAIPVELNGEDEDGVRIIVPLRFLAGESGRYWFDVLADDALLTCMPLVITRTLRPAA